MAAHSSTATRPPVVQWTDASPHVMNEARRYWRVFHRRITLRLSGHATQHGIPYPFTTPSENDPSVEYRGEIYADGTGWCSCPSHRACKHCVAAGWALDMSI